MASKDYVKFPVGITVDQDDFLERYVSRLRKTRRGWSKAAVIRVALELFRKLKINPKSIGTEQELLASCLRRIGCKDSE